MDASELLRRLDMGLDIYKHFMGGDVRIRKSYKSPLRSEKHASFNLFVKNSARSTDTNGQVWWRDHAGDSGSPWDFVMRLKYCDFLGALEYVRVSLCGLPARPDLAERLMDQYLPPMVVKTRMDTGPDFVLTPSLRMSSWHPHDNAYYPPGIIDVATRDAFYCAPLLDYRYEGNGKDFTVHATEDDPLYEYLFPGSDHFKIVRPQAKSRGGKWIGNAKSDHDVFGLHLTPAKCPALVLIAGNRDCMAGWQACEGKLPFVAMASESAYPTAEQVAFFKSVAERVYVLYDCDATGLRFTEKICTEHGFLPDLQLLYKATEVNDLMQLLEPRTPAERQDVGQWLLTATQSG